MENIINSKVISIESCRNKPECWKNDERMNVLFQPFRPREVNEIAYDNKMIFWKQCIELYCNATNTCYFNIAKLQQFFLRNNRTPSCLTAVVEDMLREHSVKSVKEFSQEKYQESWTGWATDSVKRSFSRLRKSIIVSPDVLVDDYVEFLHIATVKKMSEQVLELVEEDKTIFTYDDIRKVLSSPGEEFADFETAKLVVHWLELESKAVVSDNPKIGKVLIKLATKDRKVEPFSESEFSFYILQKTETQLKNKIEDLEREKERVHQEVKAYLKKGMKQLAKATLKKRIQIEKQIEKSVGILHTNQTLQSTAKETHEDAKILESYKVGVAAINTTLKETGLDKFDKVISDVEDTLDLHNDIQESLGQRLGPDVDVDLESELADLLMGDAPSVPPSSPKGGRKEEDISLDDLPDVPSFTLNPSRMENNRLISTQK